MNILELHSISNHSVSNLNRDENGSPKAVPFGGTPRSRISSQCFKRAIREALKNIDKVHFGGVRTRSIATGLTKALEENKMAKDLSQQLANAVADLLGTSENEKTKTVLFFSTGELDAMAKAIAKAHKAGTLNEIFKITEDKKEKTTSYECLKGKLLKGATLIDIADIELFGRMVASDPSLFVEGALSFAHPFSVHSCEAETDYFSAMDETAGKDDPGAGHVNEMEYVSACYYRCININLDVYHSSRLSSLPVQIRRDILRSVIDVSLYAVPNAKHNSMFAATMPSVCLGILRKNTFPLSLANAYEKPIRPSANGWTDEARTRLSAEWEKMKKAYGKRLGVEKELWFPDVDLDTFGKELTDNA